MQTTVVKNKGGIESSGFLWEFKPEQNLLSIMSEGEVLKFSFDNIESAKTLSTRVSVKEIGDIDLVQRARKDLEQGRQFNWNGYPKEKFNWE